MHVLVTSWSAYGGGRARALLSLLDYLSTNDIHVSVLYGAKGWDVKHLESHHDISPSVDWHRTTWDTPIETIQTFLASQSVDAVISWDNILNTKIREVSPPTIGYCRTNYSVGLDEFWAPSQHTARVISETTKAREGKTVKPIYPIWYITPDTTNQNRPIDILIHGRKENGVVSDLAHKYNIVLANRFTYPELKAVYKRSKLFLFPRPERFEPLGLMPIEAAAHGCNVLLPKNSGVAEIYPNQSYEHPTDHVSEELDEQQNLSVPESPTNPIERLHELTHGH